MARQPQRTGRSKAHVGRRFRHVVAAFRQHLRSSDPYLPRHTLFRTWLPPDHLSALDLVHLDRFLGRRPITEIRDSLIAEYTIHRQEQGAASSVINRELATIGFLTRFAERKLNVVDWSPRIEFLPDPERIRHTVARAAEGGWLQQSRQQTQLVSTPKQNDGRKNSDVVERPSPTEEQILEFYRDPENRKASSGRTRTSDEMAEAIAKKYGAKRLSGSRLRHLLRELRKHHLLSE